MFYGSGNLFSRRQPQEYVCRYLRLGNLWDGPSRHPNLTSVFRKSKKIFYLTYITLEAKRAIKLILLLFPSQCVRRGYPAANLCFCLRITFPLNKSQASFLGKPLREKLFLLRLNNSPPRGNLLNKRFSEKSLTQQPSISQFYTTIMISV